ncbi:GNAT family N-acetyltransferase [Phascolarctobacterium sp.]
MEKIKFLKTEVEDAGEIINLFNKNYKNGYYNKNFQSIAKLQELIKNKCFIGIKAWREGKIIGFSGIYIKTDNNINIVYLAHFLVDEEYRNCGIGKSMDHEKNLICESLPGKSVVYSILGLGSLSSLKVKEKSGYDFWGVRLFYGEWEPNQDGDGHLIVAGKLIGFDNSVHKFPYLKKATRKLLESCNIRTRFSKERPKIAKASLYILDRPYKVEFGQCRFQVREQDDLIKKTGVCFLEIIEIVLQNRNYPYLVISLCANIITEEIETLLYEHNFFPTDFMPFFENGKDVLEYQYLSEDKIDRISDFLPNKQEILKYINLKGSDIE